MNPRIRSAGGAVLMLAIIPAIVGLLACMPVPIGDPERSRIDPEITGAWVWLNKDDSSFFVFEPYDKRTWLLTGFGIEYGDRRDNDTAYDLTSYAGLTGLIENESIGADGVTADEITLYKVWRTKLGGEWFMTWEPKGLFDNESFVPELWYVFRVDRSDEKTLELTMLDGDLFDGVEETRRAYERVIKKNARNPELYDDEETIRLLRVDTEHFDFVAELAAQVISE